MKRKDDVIWILTDLSIILGFIVMIASISDVLNLNFAIGLLFFTLGCYWYAYRRGYGMGRIAEYERQRQKNPE